MKTKLHIASKLFIANPYVIAVDHKGSTPTSSDLAEFRHMLKTSKATITDTWGYAPPVWETIKSRGATLQIYPNFSIQTDVMVFRSYWAFTNTEDALQFRLTHGDIAKQVFMWPVSKKFTITEFMRDQCSD
jgi:hypothetical protein